MPIKVTYQDEKGNAIPDPALSDSSITDEHRALWNRMRYEGFQRGIYEDDLLDTPKGRELLDEFNITPARVSEYREDMIQKAKEQADMTQKAKDEGLPSALPEVVPGFTSTYLFQDPQVLAQARTPRMGYVSYVAQRGDKPEIDFGTNIKDYVAYLDKEKKEEDDKWSDYGDPTKDINYRESGTKSGFGSSLGLSSSDAEVAPDPRFPTRDPITGRVTPAAEQLQEEEE